jgi:hypothetical protein
LPSAGRGRFIPVMTEARPDFAPASAWRDPRSRSGTRRRGTPPADEGGTVTRCRKASLSSGDAATVRRIVAEVVGMVDRHEPARDAATRKILTEIAHRLEQEAPRQGSQLAVACGLPVMAAGRTESRPYAKRPVRTPAFVVTSGAGFIRGSRDHCSQSAPGYCRARSSRRTSQIPQ